MVIWTRPFRSSHAAYIGVFICRNKKGNEILREMEPPKHDIWDRDHPEKGANKAVENEYFGFLRECVGKLAPEDDSKVLNIPGLSRFLPDDDETPEEEFGSGSEKDADENKTEGFNPNALPTKILPSKIDHKKRTMQPDEQNPEDGENETEGGEGDGPAAARARVARTMATVAMGLAAGAPGRARPVPRPAPRVARARSQPFRFVTAPIARIRLQASTPWPSRWRRRRRRMPTCSSGPWAMTRRSRPT